MRTNPPRNPLGRALPPRDAMGAFWLGVLLALSPVARGDRGGAPSARELLARMNAAHEQRSFSGRFLYMRGEKVMTVLQQRAVIDGEVHERLLRLQGAPRQVIRRNGQTVSVHGDRSLLLLAPTANTGAGLPGDDAAGVSEQYAARVTGRGRVAGRPAWRLRLEPRDRHRYGYRLWLDEGSALLLRSELLDRDEGALERVEFVSLDPDAALDAEDFALPEAPAESRSGGQPDGPDLRVRADWLPAGYVLTNRSRHPRDDASTLYSATYSDGLASFTLFAEPAPAAGRAGLRRRGPTVVGVRVLRLDSRQYQSSLVGEIPVATARRVLNAATLERAGD